jgi:GNAT superfamily N-acetyltransferase
VSLAVRPANEASWEDLEAVFGTRGPGARCWCQRYRLSPGESFGGFPAEERAARLRDQTDCGNAGSGTTSGLVAYDVTRDPAEPVGWCAVAPRSSYDGLVRVFRVPWEGRDEDRADDSVWAITCFLVRAGHRRRGVSRALAVAAVEHARASGARAVEAYPITRTDVISEELHVGTVATFEAAGMLEVARPGTRRAVMRLDF